MRGWRRDMTWEDTGLPFIPPSPNLPSPSSCRAYPSVVFLEATSLCEGRGTTTPFTTFGAPWLNRTDNSALVLAAALNKNNITCPSRVRGRGCFRPMFFVPTFFKYNGSVVRGVQWVRGGCDASSTQGGGSFAQAAQLLLTLRRLSSDKDRNLFVWDGHWFGWPANGSLVDMYAGTPRFRQAIDKGWKNPAVTGNDIAALFKDDEDQFSEKRKSYLLY